MGIKSFFGFDCEEAAKTCQKVEYSEAGIADRWRLKFHLFLCPPCKDYSKKNHRLSYLLIKANFHSCTEDEKKSFRQRMKDQNSKTSS